MNRCAACSSDHDLYCPRCLGEGLNNHAQAHHILQTQLLASKSRCERILYGQLPSTSAVGKGSPGSGFTVASSSSPTSTATSPFGAASTSSAASSASTIRPPRTPSRLSSFLSQPTFGQSPFQHPAGSSSPSNIPARPPNPNPGLAHVHRLEAEHFRLSSSKTSLESEVDRLRSANASSRKRLDEKRQGIRRRKRALAASLAHPGGVEAETTRIRKELEKIRLDDRETQEDICAARRVLGKEVVTVFGVRPAGSLKQVGGEVKVEEEMKMEMDMEIGGLFFPSPARFTGHSSNHLNAVIVHTLHLLHLLSTYLTIKMPFTWAWSESSSLEADPGTSAPVGPGPKGFDVYPKSEAGRMIGRPMMGGGEIAFGRAVPLRRDGVRIGRAGQVDEADDDGAVFEDDSDDPDLPPDGLDWAEIEDPKVWRKKASLYVSTSRERWKRRQHQDAPEEKHRPASVVPDLSLLGVAHGPEKESEEKRTLTSTEKKPKRDKYQIKEDTMILAYSMLCYDVACLGWMCGVDLSLDQRDVRTGQGGGVDWDRVLCPLRVLWESVRSEGIGRLSHTPSIPATHPRPADDLDPNQTPDEYTIPYIPLPFSFTKLVDKATEAFGNRSGRAGEAAKGGAGDDLGGDDWDFV